MLHVHMFCISLALILVPGIAFAQNTANPDAFEDANLPDVPGIISPDDSVGPVGNTDAKYKFDAGFYQQIQSLISDVPVKGEPGVYDGTRYYNVILVVSRDMHDQNPDQTARENKDVIVERLKLLGARNIVAAEILSFVTASIPVADIPGFSLYDEVYKMGDGEIVVTSTVDTARNTIHAAKNQIIAATGNHLNGKNVTVAVIDLGINHTNAFENRILERTFCFVGGCINDGTQRIKDYNTNKASHGTKVAQVLAASGLERHNGIAPGVQLLDVVYSSVQFPKSTFSKIIHALDWSLIHGADIVNMSFGTVDPCNHTHRSSHQLITEEAVDKGMILVGTAGNNGRIKGSAVYSSIGDPGCAHNVITVGGISDRGSSLGMYAYSGKGPIKNSIILKPDLVAPGTGIHLLNHADPDAPRHGVHPPSSRGVTDTKPGSGTSVAAPQVSASAALLLQAKPELTPVQVKAALLLGATWKGPVPCTSSQYEQNNPRDGCSYARQPTNLAASNSASLEILNNVGLGILNTADSLKYVISDSAHVISDHLDSDTDSKVYRFEVTDTSQPVKIILTWLVHSHGSITDQISRKVQAANLDFTTRDPGGDILATASGDSMKQTNEFAVFTPTQAGVYTITVTGSNINNINKPVQNFALASTSPLTPVQTTSNRPPVADSQTILMIPGMEKIVRLTATDPDNDAVSFHVSKDPHMGIVTTDELIDKGISRVIYTPDSESVTSDTFVVIPHDGITSGLPATISLEAEVLPPGSTAGTYDISAVKTKDVLQIVRDFTHKKQSEMFARYIDSVSQIRVEAKNMEGAEARILTDKNATYTVVIPSDGTRDIEFDPSINIRSVIISATGIDEETVHKENSNISGHIAKASIEYITLPANSGHDLIISEIPDMVMFSLTTNTIPITFVHPQNATSHLSLGAPQFVSIMYDGGGHGTITLSPKGSDIGRHHITVHVNVGEQSATTRFTVEVFSPETTRITAPEDIAVEATAPLTMVHLGNAVISGTGSNLTATNDAPAKFPVGITIVRWTVTDSDNSTSTDEQKITILDTTKPAVYNLPPAGNYFTDTPRGAIVQFYPPQAYDIADPDVEVTSSHRRGDLFPVGNTTMTFTATDNSGNTATHSVILSIKHVPRSGTSIDNFSDISLWNPTPRVDILHRPYDSSETHNDYTIAVDSTHGNPAPSAKIFGDGYNIFARYSRTIDLSQFEKGDLFMGIDNKITAEDAINSRGGKSGIHPSAIMVIWGPNFAYVGSNLFGSSWESFNENIRDKLYGNDIIVVNTGVFDFSRLNHQQTVYIDNLYVGKTRPVSDIVRGGSGDSVNIKPPTDLSPVTISIVGDNPSIHHAHTDYKDLGAICTNISGKTWAADADMSLVDTGLYGSTLVTYSCLDSDRTFTAVRVVNIVNAATPDQR